VGIVKGIDVHGERGDVDWARVRGDGYRFAFAKASEGLDFRDPLFSRGRWESMREAGVIRGAYHYARPQPGRTGRDEAEFFLSVVESVGGRRSGDLPLVLDVEWPRCRLEARAIRAWCGDFCATVRRATGRDAITYTGNFWRDRVGGLGPPRNGAALWLPVYGPNDGTTRVDPTPFVPRGAFRLRLHQWTDRGRVAGVQHQPVDMNVWLGTLAELRAWCRDDRPRRRPRAARPRPVAIAGGAGPVAPTRPLVRPAVRAIAEGPMTVEDVQRALRRIGWPIAVDGDFGRDTREALSDFQRGYALTTLRVSGRPGPRTNRALRECVANGGRTSEHFAFDEFKSKGNGWIKVDRELVRGLEAYRRAVGGPVEIVSAYRDPAHNRRVGGASQSQHLFGNGADIPVALSRERVRALRVFSGIGYQAGSGLVRHVDVRHRGPNTTGGTVANPTEWQYP
jgi:GH25 family lysozyme M1 (1,4-beta-N-acetylmuramidase)